MACLLVLLFHISSLSAQPLNTALWLNSDERCHW